MKKAPIEFDSDVFSCIQKDEFAILTLKENALKIFRRSSEGKKHIISKLKAMHLA